LRSFGDVDGGADTVVDALLEAVGEDGTVAVPTFTFDNWKRVFDPVTAQSPLPSIIYRRRKTLLGMISIAWERCWRRRGWFAFRQPGMRSADCFGRRMHSGLGVEGYRQDPGLFTRIDDTFTVLDDGVVVGREKSVLDPGAMFPETE
jgi:hypothetical protein